jgi:hypothetical protein
MAVKNFDFLGTVGSNVLQGGALGTSLGGPAGTLVGAGLGLAKGIGQSIIDNNRRKELQGENRKLEQEAFDMRTDYKSNIAVNNFELGRRSTSLGGYYKLGGTIKLDGGKLTELAKGGYFATGNSHSAGGIELDGNNIEGGEVIYGNRVYSDYLKDGNKTFAQAAKPIVGRVGEIEEDIKGAVESGNKYKYNSAERRVGVQIAKLGKLFDKQESLKDFNSNRVFQYGGQLGDPPYTNPALTSGAYPAAQPSDNPYTFLPLDRNRPSYIDDNGMSRSEYKIGIEQDGKHFNIPTVINGVQLSDEDAIAHFRNTGEHMGMYDTQAQADKASQVRTHIYNNSPPFSINNPNANSQNANSQNTNSSNNRVSLSAEEAKARFHKVGNGNTRYSITAPAYYNDDGTPAVVQTDYPATNGRVPGAAIDFSSLDKSVNTDWLKKEAVLNNDPFDTQVEADIANGLADGNGNMNTSLGSSLGSSLGNMPNLNKAFQIGSLFADNISGMVANNRLRRMGIPKPTNLPYIDLKTELDVRPQLNAIKESEANMNRSIRQGTASSQMALSRMGAVKGQALDKTNQVLGQKENLETELINKERIGNHEILQSNLAKLDEYRNQVFGKNIQTEITNPSANVNNLAGDFTHLINAANQKESDLAQIRMISSLYRDTGVDINPLIASGNLDMISSLYPTMSASDKLEMYKKSSGSIKEAIGELLRKDGLI